ncbi:hypothetical protein HHX47_DHR1002077 [Lentinula edodes]|nr:hypothetical protein HHX47_DHR1002077 [Lentinula edodes]
MKRTNIKAGRIQFQSSAPEALTLEFDLEPLAPGSFVASTPSIASSSNSFMSILTCSPAHTRIVGCHTMTTLSSDALAAVQFSISSGAQQKSVGRAVCPTHALDIRGMRKKKKTSHTSVNEKQFRWSILLIIWCLFLSDERQIPNVYPAVTRCGGKDGRIVW